MLMQSTKTKIVAFLIILLSIIISTLIWKYIHFLPSEETIKNFQESVYVKNNKFNRNNNKIKKNNFRFDFSSK